MASVQDLEQHRAALTGHCYRMMGSAADADDAVQETMVRAWRGLGGFEERASLRTAMNYFLDTETLFPRFGLPPERPPNRAISLRFGADR